MKKWLLSIFVVCCAVLALTQTAFAADVVKSGYCGGEGDGSNLTWSIDGEGILTISGTGKMANYADSLYSGEGAPWRSYGRDKIRSVVVEDGVTSIGNYAFSELYLMTDIDLPDSVTSIGRAAFNETFSLRTLSLPSGITSIERGTFFLSGLRCLDIPAGVASIGINAFDYSELIDVYYAGTQAQWAKVTIGEDNDPLLNAVAHCADDAPLAEVLSGSCGSSVTWTLDAGGTLTIDGTGKMENYSADYIGYGNDHPWYLARKRITSIVVKSGVTQIGAYAFSDCYNASSVYIESGVTSIREYAFAWTNLTSVVLPDSVTTLGEGAFSSCKRLVDVTFSNQLTRLPMRLFWESNALAKVDIPAGITSIGDHVFYGCDQMTEVTIPAGVTRIGVQPFSPIGTIRFLGAMPYVADDILFSSAELTYCKPEYYDSFKTYFVDHKITYASLCTGGTPAELTAASVRLSAKKPTQTLSVSADSVSGSYTVTWAVDSTAASVDRSGVVTASGHGTGYLYAEVSSGGYKTLIGCTVYSQRNDLLVAELPANGLAADYPVTCSSLLTDEYGTIVGYKAAKYAVDDTSNTYYQEILQLTNSLTAGCTTDTEKAKAIQKWVSANISYGGSLATGDHVSQIYAVYAARASHCMGYSKLTGFMLYLAGIPNGIVESNAIGHMWNIALLDGTWVMIDSTWGEFGFDYNDEEHSFVDHIVWGQGNVCLMVDQPNTVKLVGVGNHELEREGITAVEIPNSVTEIFGWAFSGCSDLTGVTVPGGVTQIHSGAFSDCAALQSITLPASVAEINASAFEGCKNLVIRGHAGSYAETYAASERIAFAALPPAAATTQTIKLNGASVVLSSYMLTDINGGGTNYVRLRDIALLLNGSASQFEVGYDGSITLITNTPYTETGVEGSTPFAGDRAYTESNSPLYIDSVKTKLDAILLTDDAGNGYTYFKLRDLGRALGFNVTWSTGGGIDIHPGKPYAEVR